jgi:hypothetical protein
VEELKVAVVDPEPYCRDVGMNETESPLLGDTVYVRSIGLSKPFWEVTVTVDVAVPPEAILEGAVAPIVKFGATALTVKVTTAVREREPLEPVIVTVFAPADENVHERVEVPEPVTVAWFREHAESSAERPTIPLNAFAAVMVIVDVPAVFVFTGTVVGLAAIVNPITWNRTVAVV